MEKRKLLRVTKFIFLFLIFIASSAYAQTTPEELAAHLAEAIKTNDIEAFEALVHPQSLEYLKEHDLEQFNRIIKYGLLGQTIEKDYEIKVSDTAEEKEYNLQLNRLEIRDKFFIFPVKPKYYLKIRSVTRDEALKLTSKHTVARYYIGEEEGRWYIILTTESGTLEE
ncbi:hypothetical protein ACFL1E_00880 [Candidatus Omnitrophota bacterium]